MSFDVLFSMSTGMAKPIRVPFGTVAYATAQIALTEQTLNIKRTQYLKNPPHWDYHDPEFRNNFPSVTDEVLCDTAHRHNGFVERFYHDLGKWSHATRADRLKWKPGWRATSKKRTEVLTLKIGKAIWPGLARIEVPPSRWTADYYKWQMENLYSALRKREYEKDSRQGMHFDARKALTTEQAKDVIILISGWLDPADIRLDVPNGYDHLCRSDQGEYDWCEKCGAVMEGEYANCKKRKCPLKDEYDEPTD